MSKQQNKNNLAKIELSVNELQNIDLAHLTSLINRKIDDLGLDNEHEKFAVTNAKKKYARRQELYTNICAYLPRELGEQLRAQLKKDNIAIVDFVKNAAQIYLENAKMEKETAESVYWQPEKEHILEAAARLVAKQKDKDKES